LPSPEKARPGSGQFVFDLQSTFGQPSGAG
jgi:hypothetical protein